MIIDHLFETSIIKGLLFSALDKFGPQPIYMFPTEISESEAEKLKEKGKVRLTLRDYTQISIKNLSMIITQEDYFETVQENEELPKFAILPFPDFNITCLSFFHYIKIKKSNSIIPGCFSILVDRNSRSFLYNNLNRFKSIIYNFFQLFDRKIEAGYLIAKEILPLFKDLLLNLIEIEKKPYAPITSQTRLKVVFAGLDDSGKTSFLLAVDRKFSKLVGLKPTVGAKLTSIQALGASIFLWDLGGQISSRQKYLDKSQIYLYETDLLYYFIDIKNRSRFEESIEYFKNIMNTLQKFRQHTPIIFILSKGDDDILETPEIKENIRYIKSKILSIIDNGESDVHITSIFSIFSILRAFSSGISKLSPNRELVDYNLKKFSIRADIYLSLLLNNEGLVLAEYYLPETSNMFNSDINDEIVDVFEISAPQFTKMFKIFEKYKTLKKEQALFKIADSIILFKKIQISNYDMYLLLVIN
jgi:GTPase SAR1 family protein